MKKLMRLRPRKAMLNDFYVLDTETGIKKGDTIIWELCGRPEKFIFACIVGKNFRQEYHDLKSLLYDLKTNPRFRKRYVFAHNLFYDGTVLYGNIFDVDPKALFNGSRLICFTNGNCKFADSSNIFQGKVSDIGKAIGIEKTGMDSGNYKKSNWKNKKTRQRDIEGCYRDCEIIYEALIRMFEDAGDIKITQASLSMTYFRRYHQPFDIEHNDNTAFFFDSYFGGRTEVFKLGVTNSTVIDANSIYPYQMVITEFPNPSKLKVATNVQVKNFRKFILPHYEGCCYCDIEHDNTKFGFLPYKNDKGKLLFPNGNFSGCWNFNELRFALLHNVIKIKNIKRVVYAPRMYSPFKDYVQFLYSKRITTDNEFEKWRIKIFMNSLYGKFAQRISEETIYIDDMQKEFAYIRELQRQGILIKIQPFNAERNDCFLILKQTQKIDLSFCIPSFASYITSAARVMLLKKMLELQNNKIVYCDTDSIFFEINSGIVNDNRLGGWKVEPKIVTEIRGLKNYKYYDLKKDPQKINEIHRLKGVPKNAKKISENSFEFYNLVKTKEALRRNIDPGISMKRIKEISGIYDKRKILSNGETEPFIL